MNLEQEIQIMEMKQENYNPSGFANELDKEISQNKIDKTNYTPQTEEKSEEINNVEEQPLEEQSPEEQPVEEQSIISEEIPTPTEEEKEEENNLQKSINDTKRKKVLIFGTAAIILIIAIIGIILTTPGALTGYTTATREVQQTIDYNQTFSQSTETQLNLNNIIGLKISGKLEGTEAKVKLRINGTEYLVADIINPNTQNQTTTQYTISTDKNSYALGETVTISINPDTENKSLYISYGNETHILDNNTYTPDSPGNYQAIALITTTDNIIRIETNFTVSNETTNQTTQTETLNQTIETTPTETTNTYEFTQLCTETCNIPETNNSTLIIETAENSTLTITQITTTQQKENNAPIQIQVIPDITITTGQTTTTDLNEYFSDIDEDTIQYDINEIPEINATINQNTLTITSTTPGTYTAYIYATDGDKLITSNTFTIIITPFETNQSVNETPPIIIGETNLSNETNQTIPVTSFTDCNDPNPNLRPPECIQGNEEQYFKNTPIYLQSLDRAIVGRVTAFGNLMIRGKLVENSQASPGSRDFKISYFINDGETEVTAAWIDSQTGDLHLRGNVYEEQFSILPTSQDAFLFQNKKGTNLGFIDRHTGNLYLRGNLIQERPEQDIIE